ncbi:MAG: peptidyl-prolyl cis-trans isomerase, partial [Caulobacterales bacterium]
MTFISRSWRIWAALLAGLVLGVTLTACGLGREQQDGVITDPVVAASVNGRPIYIEDVRTYAVQRGLLQEGEDLDANSDAFFVALEEMIEVRLFATEAESRGLDREPDIRRRLQLARERVLATAIYEELQQKASDPRAVERAYRENASRLGEGQEVHLRHIQFESRDAALAAKRRLDNGERFEALAFEVSTDRATAAEGGELGFRAVESLPEPIRQLTENMAVGEVGGPVRTDVGWHLIRVEDRRERGVPSLEELRPQIINWMLFQESQQLRERLEKDARIERLREPDGGVEEPGGEVTAPASAPPEGADAPADAPPAAVAGAAPATPPAAGAVTPGRRTPPPFPFPMGPGGVYGAPPPAQAPAQPAPATPAAAPNQPASRPAAPAPNPSPSPS